MDRPSEMDRASELVPLRYVAIGGRGPEDVVADARGRVLTGVEDGRILRIDGLAEPATPVSRCSPKRAAARSDSNSSRTTPCWCATPNSACCASTSMRVSSAFSPTRWRGSGSVSAATWSPCPTEASVSPSPAAATPEPVDRRPRRTHRNRPSAAPRPRQRAARSPAGGASVRQRPRPERRRVLPGRRRDRSLPADPLLAHRSQGGAQRTLRREPPRYARQPLAGTRRPDLGVPGRPSRPPLDLLHRAAPAVRGAAARIAVRAPFRPTGTVGALAFDDQGAIVHHLARRRSGYRMVTSVCEAAGHLVLGSLWERGVAVCERPVPK